jgi:hypothetical protein
MSRAVPDRLGEVVRDFMDAVKVLGQFWAVINERPSLK